MVLGFLLCAGGVVLIGQLLVWPLSSPLLRRDQQAAIAMADGDYQTAATRFRSAPWRAAALFKAGEFKAVPGILVACTTPEAAYNTGCALAMQGKYADAVPYFETALTKRPDWEDASVNLEIARQGAARTKREGGEQLSKIGADKIVFDKPKQQAGSEGEEEAGKALSDAELRAMWLNNVQTKPADFLKSKFAYQAAMAEREGPSE